MSSVSSTAVSKGVYMYKFEFMKDGKKWHRVDKRVARKAYKAGGGRWTCPMLVKHMFDVG